MSKRTKNKTTQKKHMASAQIRLPVDQVSRLSALADTNGMTLIGIFKVYGDQFVEQVSKSLEQRRLETVAS